MEINLENLPKAVLHLTNLVVDLSELIKSQRTYSEPESEIPIDAQETADFLGVTLSTVYILNQKRKIPSCKRGKRLYFFKKDLIEWVKVGRTKTLSEIEAGADSYLASRGTSRSKK
jgi:excisionase family DNA binding protein